MANLGTLPTSDFRMAPVEAYAALLGGTGSIGQ
jgi:hypothetical protein